MSDSRIVHQASSGSGAGDGSRADILHVSDGAAAIPDGTYAVCPMPMYSDTSPSFASDRRPIPLLSSWERPSARFVPPLLPALDRSCNRPIRPLLPPRDNPCARLVQPLLPTRDRSFTRPILPLLPPRDNPCARLVQPLLPARDLSRTRAIPPLLTTHGQSFVRHVQPLLASGSAQVYIQPLLPPLDRPVHGFIQPLLPPRNPPWNCQPLQLTQFDTVPIYAHKSAIIKTVTNCRVTIIFGETGSGKSTQVLQYLHETDLATRGEIVCTQPRKVAAITLSHRVAEEMGTEVGELVGYKVGTQFRRGPNTKLLFMTDHALLNEYMRDPSFRRYSVIVVDEAHERSIYSDLLLGLMKRTLCQRSDLRVVVMSATINTELFQSYFAVDNTVPPVIEISGRTYPVDVFYEESCEDYTKAACMKAFDIHREEEPGDILVFLTSPMETERACNHLFSLCDNVVALELHGKLQVKTQKRVFEAVAPGMRKVIFATNAAETSITIPGIKYIVDTGRVREVNFDPKKNMSILTVQWVTQSSAEQRMGRAGRTDCGKCYRLYTYHQYEQFRKQSVPEILRVHLGQAMLKLMMFDVPDLLQFQFIEMPSMESIQCAMSTLTEIDACDKNGKITEIGLNIAKLSLEPRLGKMALLGIEKGIPLESVVMAAVTTVGSIFFRIGSEQQRSRADHLKTQFCDEWGDVITLVSVYKQWDGVIERLRNRWCADNCVNARSMRAARDILKEVKESVRSELGITIPDTYSQEMDVNETMAKILLECYPSNLSRFLGHRREGYSLAVEPGTVLYLHPSSALNYRETLPKWIVFEKLLTTNRTYIMNSTTVCESWITDTLPDDLLDRFRAIAVEPQPLLYVGSQVVHKLLQNKRKLTNELEEEIKKFGKHSKVQLEITGFDGNSGGKMELFTTAQVKEQASALLHSQIKSVCESIESETVEEQILPGSSVKFILEHGGTIRTIMMPNESRELKLRTKMKTTDREVKELFSEFGVVETVRLFSDAHSGDVWGHVLFKLPGVAAGAVAAKRLFPDKFVNIDVTSSGHCATFSSSAYTLKVFTRRRPLRGFGYIMIRNADDLHRISRVLPNTLEVVKSAQNFSTVGLIAVRVDRRQENQLYIQNIPTWCTEQLICSAIHQLDPEIRLCTKDILLPRGQIPSVEDEALLTTNLREAIELTLTGSAGLNRQEFDINIVPAKGKDYEQKAFLTFSSGVKARYVLDLINDADCNGCKLRAEIDYRVSFSLPRHVQELCSNVIDNAVSELKTSAAAPVDMELRQHYRRSDLVIFHVSAVCMHDLILAKDLLGKVIIGHKITLTRSQLFFLKSEAGLKLQQLVEREMKNVKMRLDYRQCVAFVHASSKLIPAAECRLMDLLHSEMPEVLQDVKLRDASFPIGLMKALVIKYGPNLDELREACNLVSLDLVLRQHIIQLQGSQEAARKLMQLVRETAASLSEPVAADPTTLLYCPVCLTPVEMEKPYVAECCCHIYCWECAFNLVQNSMQNNAIPVLCAADGCHEMFSIQDLRNLIGTLEQVYKPALRTFMMTRCTEYSYCVTPDCETIYRKAPEGQGVEFVCSECGMSQCTACNAANHAGMTCHMYYELQRKGEVAVWLDADTINHAQCPKCKFGIEKDGGCMHVECLVCHSHICWFCKQYFETSGLCYGHMNDEHNSYV